MAYVKAESNTIVVIAQMKVTILYGGHQSCSTLYGVSHRLDRGLWLVIENKGWYCVYLLLCQDNNTPHKKTEAHCKKKV